MSNLTVTYDRRKGCFNVEGELARDTQARLPIPVPSPMGWFVGKLSEALELAGIQVGINRFCESATSRLSIRNPYLIPSHILWRGHGVDWLRHWMIRPGATEKVAG